MKIRNQTININEQRNESPFVLDLKGGEREAADFNKTSAVSWKPRRAAAFYFKIKSILLSIFYGEPFSNCYESPKSRRVSVVDEFFLFWSVKILIIFIYHFLKFLASSAVFVAKSFKDIFVCDPEESKASIYIGTPCYAFEPIFSRTYLKRHLGEFLALLIVAVLPLGCFAVYNSLKSKAVSAEEYGRDAVEIISSQLAGGFENLDSNLKLITSNFQSAYQNLEDINFFLRGILGVIPGQKGDEYRAAKNIFKAANEAAESVAAWKDVAQLLLDEKDSLKRIEVLEKSIEITEPKMSAAFYALSAVQTEVLPEEIRGVFESAKDYFYKTTASLVEMRENCALLKSALGASEPKRYLLIFQNSNEIRPTGGFMGSFAEITVYRGKIIKTIFPGGGTYDLKGVLKQFVLPPEPLRLVNQRWEFQDSNWFPDFPAAAKKIKWFYESSDGPTVDGVIAINVNLVVDLLKITGPVELSATNTPVSGGKGWNKILSSENFIDEVQQTVEIDYDKKENQPKKILADFYPVFLERLSAVFQDDFVRLAKTFGEAIGQKNIQFYFSDEKLQSKSALYGMAGEIQAAGGDYLYIIHTNIAGGKTDGAVFEEAELKTDVSDSGSIINTLTVKRKHTGVNRQGFSGVRNVDYVRIYVPKGSRLIRADGFNKPEDKFFKISFDNLSKDNDLSQIEKFIGYDEKSGTKITEEFGKTAFGNWLMVEPGEEMVYTFVYQLPMSVKLFDGKFWSHTFLAQKQSGSNPVNFTRALNLPEKYRQFWSYPSDKSENKINFILDKDYYFASVFISDNAEAKLH